jgi:hypothetical protein
MGFSRYFRLPIVAASQWLMVLPATVFLGAAALRLLQPRQYQPARTSWIIFEWTTSHVSRLGAGILFIGLPSLVAIVGCAALIGAWRSDQGLRMDATAVLEVLQRREVIAVLTTATLLAGAILVFVIAHVVTD